MSEPCEPIEVAWERCQGELYVDIRNLSDDDRRDVFEFAQQRAGEMSDGVERCQGELWTRKRITPMEIKDGEPVDIPALFEALEESELHARENPIRIGAKR